MDIKTAPGPSTPRSRQECDSSHGIVRRQVPAILSPPSRLFARRLQNNPNVHKSNCRRWSASPGSPNLKLGIRKSRQASSPQVLYTKSSIKIETQTRKAPKRKPQRDMKRGSSDLMPDSEDCNPKLQARMNSEALRDPRRQNELRSSLPTTPVYNQTSASKP